jgi:hypothetical protein
MEIKAGYFDWKEDAEAKKFIAAAHKKGLKVYHQERNWDAFQLIAAKRKPIPQELINKKSGGYINHKPAIFTAKDVMKYPLKEVTEKDFEFDKPQQVKTGGWW